VASKERVDHLLVSRGLCESREKAKRLIMAGEVKSGTVVISKPSSKIAEDAPLEIKNKEKYVSRGGLKLEGALDEFQVNPEGWVCLDVGSSTGGFTDCLLQRGAVRVHAIDVGTFRPGDRLVESDLAERFGVSRTPIREALQRLETQSLLSRDGRSLIVASLDHNQMAELYVVRSELEGLAARLAARHATEEEVRFLRELVEEDQARVDDPAALAQTNRKFHRQVHLASHNRYLVQQLDLLYRSMALMATTSLSAEGRSARALAEHAEIVEAVAEGDSNRAAEALRGHISRAFEARLRRDADEAAARDPGAQ